LSFDVFLQHFQRGEPAGADRAAVAAVLRELNAAGPDDHGYYHVVVSDLWEMVRGRSGPVEELEVLGGPDAVPTPAHRPYLLAISAGDLDGEDELECCAFFLHAFSPGIAEVIFRIADAGGMAIMPAARIGPLLPPTADPADLPDGMSRPHRIASGPELFSFLSGDYGRWRRWCDRVISGMASRQPLLRGLARAFLARVGNGRA